MLASWSGELATQRVRTGEGDHTSGRLLHRKDHGAHGSLPARSCERFGLPKVGVTAGPLTSSFDPDGYLLALSFHGHALVDVCAALG